MLRRLADGCSTAPRAWFGSFITMDILLPIIIYLHMFKSSVKLALGLLVIWLAWRLVLPVVEERDKIFSLQPSHFYRFLGLGLLLVNTRLIVLREDKAGPAQFLLIALGLAVAYAFTHYQWKHVLSWIGLAALPLFSFFAQAAWRTHLSFDFSTVATLYDAFCKGHGGINRFATLTLIITVAAWYSARLSSQKLCKGILYLSALLGYLLCLGTGSRASAIGVPVALFAAFLARRYYHVNNKTKFIAAFSVISLVACFCLYWYVLGADALQNRQSDAIRMQASLCWISMMFHGENGVLFGIGYGSARANQLCYGIKDFEGKLGSIGHAHNTFAQIAGHHGVLGLLAIVIFVLLIVVGLRNQLRLPSSSALGPDDAMLAFFEASLGVNLAILLNAMATTVYISNHLNQVLIGVLAAMALSSSRLPASAGAQSSP